MRKTAAAKKAIGYVRVSTADQAAEGVSLEAQREKIDQYAELHGFDLHHVYEDSLSAKRADNRPGLAAALDAVSRCRGVLVVFSLSRFARSTKDAIHLVEQLEGCGADLASISEQIDTTSGMGRFVFRLFASLAELERDQVSERTKLALAHKRQQGQRISGRLPYGYDLAGDGRTLQANRREQGWLRRIKEWRGDGWSMQAICDELNRRRVKAKTGGLWGVSSIQSVLRR